MRGSFSRRRAVAGLCAIVVAALAVVLANDDEPAPPRPERVIQDDRIFLHAPASLASNLDEIKALGFTRLRVTADWSSLAPTPRAAVKPAFDAADPAAYERFNEPPWENLDRVVREAASRDIDLLIDLGFWAPRWAAEPTRSGSTENPRTNIDVAEYADFGRAVAQRYSGNYTPPDADELPAVEMFSIWNEPNIPGFFGPQWRREGESRLPRSPHLYRAMLAAAYPAIKDVRPDATVLVGGLASEGSNESAGPAGGVPPLYFIREMACVDRRLEPLRRDGCGSFERLRGDGFSIHPYGFQARPEEPAGRDSVYVADLGRLIELLDALADRGRIDRKLVEVYITEFGYRTDPPDRKGISAEKQRRYWLRAEEIAASHPEVRMFAQFLIRDSVCQGCLFWPTGYRYADGRPKPLMNGLESTAG